MAIKRRILKTPVKGQKSRLDIIKESRLKKVKFSGSHIGGSKKMSRKIFWKKFRKVALVLLGVTLVVAVIGALRIFAYLQDLNDQLPTPESVFPDRPVASEIYDRTGTVTLRRVFNEYNSDPVDITEVPETVKWAFLASEDVDFYTHQGFDPAAIIRCGIANLRNSETVCGGSTITQQLVKITAPGIGSSVSIERKIKELLLAVRVEQQYDKDQILEMYLRVAPFGANIYGIRTAANFYFGKETKDLTLAEATVLAGIIQSPIKLSPTLNQNKEEVFCRVDDGIVLVEADTVTDESGAITDRSGNEVLKTYKYKCRQLYILGQMAQKQDKINDQIRANYEDPEMDDTFYDEIIDEARVEELKFQPPVISSKAGHFTDYVLDYLTTRNYKNGEEPFTNEELQKGGYRIITTLDYQIQQFAESYVQGAVDQNRYLNMNNAALMTTRPNSGEILAMAGSRSYSAASDGCDANNQNCKFNGQVNIFRTLQSPGSMNKPIGYYTAFKNGQVFTKSVLPDIPFTLVDGSGVGFEFKNWNGTFLGMGTVEDMLRASRNLPAVQIVELIGYENYINTAKEWGYTSYRGDEGPAVILGGADIYGDEHAQAFSVFANNGDLVKLNPILEIKDKDGNVIYTATPDRKSVGDPQAIYLLNQTLKNLDGMSWDQRELAGKTGTSEDSRDAWMILWSPDFISLAWGGNNNNEPMDRDNGYPPIVIQPWLKNYMRDIGGSSYLSPKTPFTRPGSIYEGGGDCNEDGCLGLGRGFLIEGRTPIRDVKQNKILVCKDQQDKRARPIDIAMGMSEEKAFNYYVAQVPHVQDDLDKYLRDNARPAEGKYQNGGPGEGDFCTIDRSGGISGPFFSFGTVSATAGNSIHIVGGVFSTTGSITSVQFYLDNQLIPSCTTTSYESFDITCNINSLNLDDGFYDFYSKATDSSSKTNNSSALVVQVGDAISTNIEFTAMPPASLTYGVTVNPLTHNIEVRYNVGGATMNNVQLYQIRMSDNSVTLLGNMSSIAGGKWRYTWGAAVPNQTVGYRFFVRAKLTGSTGQLESLQSSQVNVSSSP